MMIRRARGLGARKPPSDGARTHEVSLCRSDDHDHDENCDDFDNILTDDV